MARLDCLFFIRLFFNTFSLFIIVVEAELLVLPPAGWSLDLVQDVVFSRLQGNVLHNVHSFSILVILAASVVLTIRERELGPPVYTLLGMATAKELLTAAMYAPFGLAGAAVIGLASPTTFGVPYGVYLVAIEMLSLALVHPWQRRAIMAALLLTLVWGLAANAMYYWFGAVAFEGTQVLPYGFPSPVFHALFNNLDEVAGWSTCSLLLLTPKRWWSLGALGHRRQASVFPRFPAPRNLYPKYVTAHVLAEVVLPVLRQRLPALWAYWFHGA